MGWVVNDTPQPLYTQERDKIPSVQEAGSAPRRFGRLRKMKPLPGFDSRTVEAVVSRYTDYAITGRTLPLLLPTGTSVFPIGIIPLILNTHSPICHQR